MDPPCLSLTRYKESAHRNDVVVNMLLVTMPQKMLKCRITTLLHTWFWKFEALPKLTSSQTALAHNCMAPVLAQMLGGLVLEGNHGSKSQEKVILTHWCLRTTWNALKAALRRFRPHGHPALVHDLLGNKVARCDPLGVLEAQFAILRFGLILFLLLQQLQVDLAQLLILQHWLHGLLGRLLRRLQLLRGLLGRQDLGVLHHDIHRKKVGEDTACYGWSINDQKSLSAKSVHRPLSATSNLSIQSDCFTCSQTTTTLTLLSNQLMWVQTVITNIESGFRWIFKIGRIATWALRCIDDISYSSWPY